MSVLIPPAFHPKAGNQASGPLPPFSHRAEERVARFIRSVLDPALLIGMGAAGLVYRTVRFRALNAMLSSPPGGWGIGILRPASAMAGFSAEVPGFILVGRGVRAFLGEEREWSPKALGAELISGYLVLGGLKLGGLWTRSSIKALKLSNNAMSGFHQGALHQAGMLTGIMAGHGAESFFRLRPSSGDALDTLSQSLATLLHFNVAGAASRILLGRKFRRLEEMLDNKEESLMLSSHGKMSWETILRALTPLPAVVDGLILPVRGAKPIRGSQALPWDAAPLKMVADDSGGGRNIPLGDPLKEFSLRDLRTQRKILADPDRDGGRTLRGLEILGKVSALRDFHHPRLQGAAQQLLTKFLRRQATPNDVIFLADGIFEKLRLGKDVSAHFLLLEGLAFHHQEVEIRESAEGRLETLWNELRRNFRKTHGSVEGLRAAELWLRLEEALEHFHRTEIANSVWLLMRLAQHRSDPEIITQLRTHPHPLVRLDFFSTLKGHEEIYERSWEDHDRYSIPDSLVGNSWIKHFYARRLLNFYSQRRVEEAGQLTPALESIFPSPEETGSFIAALSSSVPPASYEVDIPKAPPVGELDSKPARSSGIPPEPLPESRFYPYKNDRHASDAILEKISTLLGMGIKNMGPESFRKIEQGISGLKPSERVFLARKLGTLALGIFQHKETAKQLLVTQIFQSLSDRIPEIQRVKIYEELEPAMIGAMQKAMVALKMGPKFAEEAGRQVAGDLLLWDPELSALLQRLGPAPESATAEEVKIMGGELKRYRDFPGQFLPLSEVLTRIALDAPPSSGEIKKAAARSLMEFRTQEITEVGIQRTMDLLSQEARRDQALRYTLILAATQHQNGSVRRLAGKGLDQLSSLASRKP